MGVHHYKFHLVPESTSPWDAELAYWYDQVPNLDHLNKYRSILPVDKSWGNTEEYRHDFILVTSSLIDLADIS